MSQIANLSQHTVSRFWCPRDGRFSLGDGGYLADPSGDARDVLNPDLVEYSDISDQSCLVLLGEPGIGKTTALHHERQAVERGVSENEELLIWQDLSVYDQGDAPRLRDDIFAGAQWQIWRDTDRILHIYLDSFDECRLYLRNVANVLLDGLRCLPHRERILFRLACRTGAWSQHLEDGLRSLWGDDGGGVYELAPLRRTDVEDIARAGGIEDTVGFLAEVEKSNAVPFAIKPVTLNFLIALYLRDGRFPPTQAQLYENGCLALCEESSSSRHSAGALGLLDEKRRKSLASRIAAMTLFCGKDAIWVGSNAQRRPKTDLSLAEISGGSELVDADSFEVSVEAVRDVVCETGLFTSRGANRMGWAHRTYAEYLTAEYVHRRAFSPAQVRSLLLHPQMQDRVVPQLRETAAWLAGLDSNIFKLILQIDPVVLLSSDVANRATEDRHALVAAILQAADRQLITDFDPDIRSRYASLAHRDLARQLQPYIRNSNKNLVVRRIAIDIAETCECRESLEDLVHVMLDRADVLQIRVEAARAVTRIGDENSKRRLRDLLTTPLDEDTEDDLRGCALRGLWPDNLSTVELFRHVTPPKRSSYFGAYAGFLRYDLMKGLNHGDLCEAINWAATQERRRRLPLDFVHLIDEIILAAWNHLDALGVVNCLANLLYQRFRFHKPFVDREKEDEMAGLIGDFEGRRRLVDAIVSFMANADERYPGSLLTTTPPLLTNDDLDWLIERLDAEGAAPHRSILAKMVASVFRARGFLPFDPVYHAARRHHELGAELPDLVAAPVDINSEEADRLREQFRDRQRWTVDEEERPRVTPPPSERVQTLLVRCEDGDLDAWWQLTQELTLEPTSRHYGDFFESDLTSLPGWIDASGNTRLRIVEAAKSYIDNRDSTPEEWFDQSGVYYHPACAGFKAFRLLLDQGDAYVSGLGAETWQRWIPVLLAYPISGSDEGEDVQQELVKCAYERNPQAVIDWLLRLIDVENRNPHPRYVVRRIAHCWDKRLEDALYAKLQDPSLAASMLGQLAEDLLEHGADINPFAESILQEPIRNDPEKRNRVQAIAVALLKAAPDAGWPMVWKLIRRKAEVGREVFLRLAFDEFRRGTVVGRISEGQAADLYLWLLKQFPREEDPQHEGAHGVVPREALAHFRDDLFEQLKRRGTSEAVDAIRRIADSVPDVWWMKFAVVEAQHIALKNTWLPAEPSDFKKLAADCDTRMVESESQLLDVVIESLRRYADKLQGETPANFRLWNEQPNGAWRPKEENRISDELKIHLQDDLVCRGVIANREVEIRPGQGDTAGEVTDIHVVAVLRADRREAFQQVRVIVEVKGCWHREVREAMQTQLRDRYLRGNNCQHGLYVVGWFLCNQWDQDDHRYAAAKRLMPESVTATQQCFEDQARELSSSDVTLRALVIDASLRSPPTAAQAKAADKTTQTKSAGKKSARKRSVKNSANKKSTTREPAKKKVNIKRKTAPKNPAAASTKKTNRRKHA